MLEEQDFINEVESTDEYEPTPQPEPSPEPEPETIRLGSGVVSTHRDHSIHIERACMPSLHNALENQFNTSIPLVRSFLFLDLKNF